MKRKIYTIIRSGLLLLIVANSHAFAQGGGELNEKKCWSYVTAYDYEDYEGRVVRGWDHRSDEMTVHECLSKQLSLHLGRREMDGFPKRWDEVRLVKACTCYEGGAYTGHGGSGSYGQGTHAPIMSGDCGSRSSNRSRLSTGGACFKAADPAAYNDFQELLGGMACGIYLDGITCSGSRMQFTWYAKDARGTRINVPNDQRAPIDGLYHAMQQHSKERQVEAVQHRLEMAQRREEVEALMRELARLVTELREGQEAREVPPDDLVREDPGASDRMDQGQEPVSSPDREDVDQLTMDADKDGTPDMQATRDADGQIHYQPIPAAAHTSEPEELKGSTIPGGTGSLLEALDPEGAWSAAEQKQLGNARRALAVGEFLADPTSPETRTGLVQEALDMILKEVPLVNFMFGRFGTGIPNAMHGTYSSMVDASMDVLQGREPDQGAMYRATTNWLGAGALGISGLGDKALDTEAPGAMQRMWNYLLEDLYEKNGRP